MRGEFKRNEVNNIFKNLKAEMAREGISGNVVAKIIGITGRSFSNKILCNSEFTRSEMAKIQRLFKERFGSNFTWEYLFELSETQKTA